MAIKLKQICITKNSTIIASELRGGNVKVFGAGMKILGHTKEEAFGKNYICLLKDGANAGFVYYINESSSVVGTMQYIIPNKDKVINKYLYYILLNIDFTQFISGTTIPHLYFRDWGELDVDIPNLNEQQKIIDIIEPMEKIEFKVEFYIKELLLIIKNFKTNEKFKFSDVSELIKNKSKGINQVSAKVIKYRNPLLISIENPGTYKTNTFFCNKGTLLINTIRTYLNKFAILNEDADVNGTLAQIKVNKENETDVILNLIDDDFWKKTELLSHGTKMPLIKKDDILSIEMYKSKNNIDDLFKIIINASNIKKNIKLLKEKSLSLLIK